MKKGLLTVLVFLMLPSAVFASIVSPVSYDMINGGTGSYNYWDESYTGTGNKYTNYAPLSGGLGDLTDGIVANANWNVTESPAGPGPYVGWMNLNPVIKFHFSSLTNFENVNIYFDDANGYGGVSAPSGVRINGNYFPVADPAGSAPFMATFNISSIEPVDELSIELIRRNSWVFTSEVRFEANPVPVPAALWFLGSGIVGLAGLKRRKRTR